MSYTKKIKAAPTADTPLTAEERKEQLLRFLFQKRESFAQGILFNMIQGHPLLDTEESKKIVANAVAMADCLIETLYPQPEQKEE